MSIRLEHATVAQLTAIAAMEHERDTAPYIIPYSFQEHLDNLNDPALLYLTIVLHQQTVGFFILARDSVGRSVEFRRIVVASASRGVGQKAIELMEQYCREALGARRIWLDVFAHNPRGRHIYEKLGYTQFGASSYLENPLLLYAKEL